MKSYLVLQISFGVHHIQKELGSLGPKSQGKLNPTVNYIGNLANCTMSQFCSTVTCTALLTFFPPGQQSVSFPQSEERP